MLQGCNLTGGEALWTAFKGRNPVSGTDYLFVSDADVDACLASGMTVFRLVFSLEAWAQDLTYKARLDSRTAYIRGKGAVVVLDIHPGDAALAPSWQGAIMLPGSAAEGVLVSCWTKMAQQYLGDQGVHFGIMNEPNKVTPAQWFQTAQRVLSAIRATGATNQVWMPGAAWSGAGNWAQANGAYWNLVDPFNKTGVQVHMYFDANAGGGDTSIASADVGVTRLMNATAWCRSKNLKLFLGEVALSASNPLAADAWKHTLDYINANSDVIAGWAWWAYGPPSWWGTYQFTLCNGSPQMKLAFPPPVVDPHIAQIAALQAEVTRWTDRVTLLEGRIAAARLALG